MLGAIIGDIVGSRFEFNNHRDKKFELFTKNNFFTDDTVCTCAIANALLEYDALNTKTDNKLFDLVVENLQKYCRIFTNRGYGCSFYGWIYSSRPEPYYSWGNGAAMRVSPVAYYAKNEKEVKKLTKIVTSVTHNHPEALLGAEVTAMCIYKCLHGANKSEIKQYALKYYPQIAEFDYEKLKKYYKFNETCRDTVPQAIYCFLISDNFEDCVRTCVSIGGDTDTLGAISCAIAESYYCRLDFKENPLVKLPLKQYFSGKYDYMLYEPIIKMYDKYNKNDKINKNSRFN